MCLRIRIAPESLAWRYGNVLATGFILTPKETKIMDRGGVGSPGSGDGMTSILKKRTEDISPECVSLIRQALEDACADQERGIPGVTFLVANRDGKQIFAHAAGKRGKGVNEPMALDSMITGIACKQLVEQGKLSLDDAEQVEGICPELKDLKVVQKHLTTLLNDGTLPKTCQQLLTKSTVDQMFENQIPHIPNFGRQDTHLNSKPDFVKNVPDFYPLNNNEPQGWGLSFMITSSVTGRSLKSGMWAGIANLFWWCDREHGIAGVISTQILPFGDVKLFGLWADVEKKVYDSLK
ncbi:hypothetical protein ACO22_05489 [Paracoccidioides brasiliensis]|uniref:Beta-lactamase-related domain-containing protein n=1 Tax=Paracoccidioides brasiliensis TaxID=121759 RepID=A0A1D2JA39_PARBR|nr:hypothetical protein ACO22_05489 [Paracoccidioides brasiliensis]